MCRRRSVRKPWKSTFSITPLSYDSPSPGNPGEYPQKPFIARIWSHWVTFSSLIVWAYHHYVRGGVRKTHLFWNRVRNGPLGNQRSLIFAPIICAYAHWWSIVTLVLPCSVSEILLVSCWKEQPHPYSTRIWVCSLGLDCRCCGSEERKPKVIIRVINFELVQPIGWSKKVVPRF